LGLAYVSLYSACICKIMRKLSVHTY
jgi:hypothetical protein